ncbi:RagB/SusD family nutrient uptake outer membrane protein [Bacteroides caecimuris]|jgi:hypothetical protein|uniref:RagB/SusD family nutrient uptake outer membrane protein n=1 Tax=Bacteroides caecimuris TaxID=1796613 RepID=A0A1C7GVD8_9BACE|nr:RagB/SusD family nutrient uptake outer membrane protein [Bacteroides caecimuris]ANU56189.1 RagB/SusD family nutrient uptake outer membrane protein [Bacteroides caecimuris]NDO58246.1 RagB/SusD family nutrient uptake outer membrane protein [Bacteroides caecimuris]OXE63656.1 RagB/SusD family nutrient uptake outer membrane protein [Bacteroides caecimuris]QQR18971.1 RagB/SusD family nutrient uptake outer membrane protein [Bacteroides caecimuris]UQA32002.1 RagB/SusD family nutrient uptake outer m
MKNIFKLLAFLPLLTACDDLFEPALENNRDLEAMYKEPSYAQGILANAYIILPYETSPTSDLATDDAVTNEISNSYLRMATGSWTANNNPVSQWQNRFNAIQYINLFLENVDKVEWAKDERISTMFLDRLKGEAYGLRALHMYYLLRAHGGKIADGTLMGVPIILKSEGPDADFNHARATYSDCVKQIMEDADKAIELLPLDYKKFEDSEIPEKYKNIGVTNASDYRRVCGEEFRGLMSGRIALAVRAQTALLAASPAFQSGSGMTWEQAADYAAEIVEKANGGGGCGLDANGLEWYTLADNDYGTGGSPAEVIWRSSTDENNTLEAANFPPSLYGNGRVNPTQNLVDAFPMANGYPISETSSEYDAENPYNKRDPRLAKYIVYNGGKQGPNDSEIITGTYGTNTDVVNKESGRSTRTGYYLRKLLRKECNPNPQYNTTKKHYTARIRYTEMFLIYAEAANEAWGPQNSNGHRYSAYDVIKAIRTRAGLGTDNGDAYLESIKNNNDKDKMRELIRNERRIELCFENFRFWDLRRWNVNLTKLNEIALGVEISKSGATMKYTPLEVENRKYEDYMIYGPLPFAEVMKWSNLEQNVGWK